MKLKAYSLEADYARRIEAGETMITDKLPKDSARHVVTALGRWWRSLGDGHDADAVIDVGRCEVSGWTSRTPEAATADWRLVILTF